MKVLVTGGAGYIGSFMVARLIEEGYEVVIIDSLERGHMLAVHPQAQFEKGDLHDVSFVSSVFDKYEIEAVFHFAAYISVPESVKEPGKYYLNNVGATLTLLEVMSQKNIKKLIFSSTAAVYGNPQTIPIPEDHPKHPESPYGHSKLIVEEMLERFRAAYQLDYVVLRYFNASGAALDGSRGEGHIPETHMIPCAINALLTNKDFTLFGTDYETDDGTCVRDYIHVVDLVEAHILAFRKIRDEGGKYYFNVGTGKGYSNKEVVAEVKKVAERELSINYAERRPGDPATLIADASKIKSELGFEPKYSDLNTIVASAWKWHQQRHPENLEPKT